MGDASRRHIACFETKYFYEFWRPTSAIRLADTDGNAATTMDAAWTPVVTTPNHPEYPSAHMCQLCRHGRIEGALRHQPDHVQLRQHGHRNGASVRTPDELLNEIILARIHGGMHFRTAERAGWRARRQRRRVGRE